MCIHEARYCFYCVDLILRAHRLVIDYNALWFGSVKTENKKKNLYMILLVDIVDIRSLNQSTGSYYQYIICIIYVTTVGDN